MKDPNDKVTGELLESAQIAEAVQKMGLPQAAIKDAPNAPVDLHEIRHYACTTTGIEIHMAIPANPLEKPKFRSAVNILTNQGPATLQFMIDADTITEAAERYVAAAKAAVEEAKRQMKENARRIIVPGALGTGIPQAPFRKVN